MPTTIAVPDGYQYVTGSLLLPVFVLIGHTFAVSKWRRRAQIKYPAVYADAAVAEKNVDALIFNCAQRAHQNTLEVLPMVVLSTAIAGLKYPYAAAATCAFWCFSRIPYTRGYMSGDPAKRVGHSYRLASIGAVTTIGIAAYHVATSIYESL